MASRLNLQTELETILGTRNVYFQPPESKKLQYDCIVYNRSNIDTKQADNYNYLSKDGYEVTLIYRDPDNELPHAMLRHFKYCRHVKHLVVDNLYHDVFRIYY